MIDETTRCLFGLSLFSLILGKVLRKYPKLFIGIPGAGFWYIDGEFKFLCGSLKDIFGEEGAIERQKHQGKVAFAVSAFFAYLAVGNLVLSILGKK